MFRCLRSLRSFSDIASIRYRAVPYFPCRTVCTVNTFEWSRFEVMLSQVKFGGDLKRVCCCRIGGKSVIRRPVNRRRLNLIRSNMAIEKADVWCGRYFASIASSLHTEISSVRNSFASNGFVLFVHLFVHKRTGVETGGQGSVGKQAR